MNDSPRALRLADRIRQDAVPETAAHLATALEEAARRDAEVARLAQEAPPAGDPDPYRRPAEDGEE